MNVVFGFLLIILGLLAVADYLGQRIKGLQAFVTKISPFVQLFGLAGLLFGAGWILEAVYLLIHVDRYPIFTIVVWVLAPTMVALGMIFGLDLLSKIIGYPPSSFIIKAMHLRDSIRVYQNKLGLFAIVSGLIYMFF